LQLSYSNPPLLKDLMAHHPTVKAILWDMDGTIMSTEKLHAQAIYDVLRLVRPIYPSIHEIEELVVGKTDFHAYELLNISELSILEFIDQKNTLLRAKFFNCPHEDILLPAVADLISEIANSGLKQVIVTSSEKEAAHISLQHLKLQHFFDHIITREDTEKNKPDPMPYFHALNILSLEAKDVIIFEDSPTGLAAAMATQALTIHAKWYY